MFETRFVDAFSRTHPVVVPMLFVPAAAALGWLGARRGGASAGAMVALVVAGFLVWTLTEYWLHRLVFHWTPSARWGPRFHFLLHGVHHEWPRDKYRLVMPPAVSVTLFWVFFAAFFACLGAAALPFHAGFTLGYVNYDLTHYYVHHFSPRSRRMQALRRHHLMHHSQRYDAFRYGVSTSLWDHVFRTVGPEPEPGARHHDAAATSA